MARLFFAVLLGLGAVAAASLLPRRARKRVRVAVVEPVPVPPPVALPPEPPRRGLRTLTPVLILLGIGFAVFMTAFAAKRERERLAYAAMLTSGDPDKGPALMVRYGCAGCHTIDGVRGPAGRVGPPLGGIGQRVYIAGVLTNTPDNLVRWIVDPRAVDPKTAMPATGISEAQARDVAAYLYALR